MAGASKGALITGGLKKAATWGTPILVAALNEIEVKSHSITPKVQFLPNESLTGKMFQFPGDLGVEGAHTGDVVFDAQYETMDTLIALALGTAGAPAQQGADIAYKHVWKPSNDIFGLFGTLVFDYQTEVWEFASCKVKGWKLECDKGAQVAKMSFSVVIDQLNRNTGSGTNKTSTIAGITRINTNRSRLLFSQVSLKLNAQLGGALAGGDAQLIEGFTLEFMRTMKEDDVTTQRGRFIDEPQDNGFGHVKLGLKFSRYDSGSNAMARVADLFTKAQNKCSIVFSGPLASGATNYSATFYLNGLQLLTGAPVIPGPGLTPFTIEAEAHAVPAVATGFPAGYTDALDMEWIDGRSTDALA